MDGETNRPGDPRLVLFHNVIAPYRLALFREMADSFELRVLYSVAATRDRTWEARDEGGYAHRVLGGYPVYLGNRPMIFCPGLIREVRSPRCPELLLSVLTKANAVDIARLAAWSRRRGVPLLFLVGETERVDYEEQYPLLHRLFEPFFRHVLRLAAGFLYYSQSSRRWAERRGARGPFLCGTQVLGEPPGAPRIEVPGREGGGPIVGLYVGKMERRKGVDRLVEAIASLDAGPRSELEVRFIGDGDLKGRVLDGEAKGLPVRYLGAMRREELFARYREADFLVLPSRHDPWGFVVNEAMSMGTPALVSTAAGSADLAGQAGWVFRHAEEGSLKRALERAVREARDASLRQAAVRAEGRYRPREVVGRLRDLAGRVLAGRARGKVGDLRLPESEPSGTGEPGERPRMVVDPGEGMSGG